MKYKILALLFVSFFCYKSIFSQVKTGIDVLENEQFLLLKGKKVGLITNPTGVNAQLRSTVDILFEAEGVELVALYAPEHGVRGNFSAGDHVGSSVDEKTGLPVFSLYGSTQKPTAEMLKGIDVLVYDIQDIGARSYTFISTMGLAMEAAAENNIPFVVLDRPNPLNGLRVEGAMVEDGYYSFVSQYNIPYIYGLTPAELAQYLNGEGLLKNGVKCDLTVVKMQGWQREMTFPETGLHWVPTSPHIPRSNSAFYYAMSGILGELDANMIGVGYTLPFEIFALQNVDADKVAEKMNSYNLSGVVFRPIYFKPYYMTFKGKEFAGVQVYFTDINAAQLTPIQFYFAEAIHDLYPDIEIFATATDRHAMFDKVCGSNKIRLAFTKNYKFSDIEALWNDNEEYKVVAKKYWLY